MKDNSYLGTGMKFPISIDPATGRINTSSGTDSVRESIYLILMTSKTERFIRPDFGASLSQYAFMDVTRSTLHVLKRNLSEMILNQEPRIRSVSVDPEPDLDNGRILINISYTVAENYTSGSLVFPFYLNTADRPEAEADSGSFEDYDNLIDYNEDEV